MKLKDKNGTILNVSTKATYQALIATGNYTVVEDKKVKKEEEKASKE